MNRSTTSLLAGGAAAALAFGLMGPATAATRTFTDASGDMDHGADIQSVKVANDKSVRIAVHTADLVPSYQSGAGLTIYLDTDPKSEGPEYAFLGGMFEGTDYGLVRTNGWKTGTHPTTVDGFYIMKLDFDNDVARVKISRGALGKPGKVRVAVRTTGEQADGTIVKDWLGGRRQFTKWVARG